jgi:hypothetical protein
MPQTTNLGLEMPLGTDNYNIAVTNANMVLIDTAMGERAMKSVIIAKTLTSAGWLGSSAPYTQTVDIEGLAADANGTVGLAPTATAAQMEAAADAKLLVTAQAAGSITVSAFGDKPTINLPIQILIVG